MRIMAIALAGGKSSRMGKDKALLQIKGTTLLFQISRMALEIADAVYIVARSQDQYIQAIADATDSMDSLDRIHLVVDQKFEGALVGFEQGMRAIADPPDWIMLLACDLPNLRTDVLKLWASQLKHLPEQAIAYLPRHVDDSSPSQKQWEPLCGFYRWSCQDSLTDFIQQGGRSFQKWLNSQEVIEIPQVPSTLLFNCNTLEDFRSIAI